MIKLLSKGSYRLVGTKDNTNILYLGEQGYHWAYAPKIGHLLTFCKHAHKQWYVINQGSYKIYEVKDDPKLVDLKHLQLSIGKNQWQGYLLLTDLPSYRKIRRRIEPTEELIKRKH